MGVQCSLFRSKTGLTRHITTDSGVTVQIKSVLSDLQPSPEFHIIRFEVVDLGDEREILVPVGRAGDYLLDVILYHKHRLVIRCRGVISAGYCYMCIVYLLVIEIIETTGYVCAPSLRISGADPCPTLGGG